MYLLIVQRSYYFGTGNLRAVPFVWNIPGGDGSHGHGEREEERRKESVLRTRTPAKTIEGQVERSQVTGHYCLSESSDSKPCTLILGSFS